MSSKLRTRIHVESVYHGLKEKASTVKRNETHKKTRSPAAILIRGQQTPNAASAESLLNLSEIALHCIQLSRNQIA